MGQEVQYVWDESQWCHLGGTYVYIYMIEMLSHLPSTEGQTGIHTFRNTRTGSMTVVSCTEVV